MKEAGGRKADRGGSRIVRQGAPPSAAKASSSVAGAPPSVPTRPRLRPLDEPRHVRVEVDAAGAPLRIAPRRGAWRSVLSVRERWRIDDEWWRDPLSREYFQVVLQDGRVVELYRDEVRSAWYAHGGGSAFADR